MTVRNSAMRIGAGSVAAALVMCTVALVGTANADTNPDRIDIRPVPTQNPTGDNGFQDAPFITNAMTGAKVNDFQVVVDNMWKTGDALNVTLPAGVVFASAPTVTATGPTTLESVRQNSTTQVVQPQDGLRNPTVSSKLSTDPGANGGTAQVIFTNDSSEAPADPNVRFVLTFTGVRVNTSTNADQGPLTASISVQNRIPGGAYGLSLPTGTTTTLAFITNVDLSVTSKPIIPNGGYQTIGPISFAETVPEALVNGMYTVEFTQGENNAPIPVAVGNPNPAGGEFDVNVTGSATKNGDAVSNTPNSITIDLGGLNPDGALESFALTGVRLDPINLDPIHVTLTAVPLTSNTNLTFNAVNQGPSNLSRVPDQRGLDASNTIGILPQDQRIGGNDRYQTAAQIAEQLQRGEAGIDTFVIASGEQASDGVDALAANFLAGALAKAGNTAVPILLTKQGVLPDVTAVAINNILTRGGNQESIRAKIYVVGGPSAVSDNVIARLRTVAQTVDVQRVAGSDRYDTAAAVATVLGEPAVGSYEARFGQGTGNTAFLSNGVVPADALSAGPIAYRSNFPVLLTQAGSLPQATINALDSDNIRNVILLGGPSAVSDSVVTQLTGLGYTVTRVSGADRYATNAALYAFANTTTGGSDMNPRGGLGYPAPYSPLLANGIGFADALTAGPLAAVGNGADLVRNSPLLLTAPAPLSAATKQYLVDNKTTISYVTGVGLAGALPQATIIAANQAAS